MCKRRKRKKGKVKIFESIKQEQEKNGNVKRRKIDRQSGKRKVGMVNT